MHVFLYFLHLVPTFPPHDIIAEKGLLWYYNKTLAQAAAMERITGDPPPPQAQLHTLWNCYG